MSTFQNTSLNGGSSADDLRKSTTTYHVYRRLKSTDFGTSSALPIDKGIHSESKINIYGKGFRIREPDDLSVQPAALDPDNAGRL